MSLADLFTAELNTIAAESSARQERMLATVKRCQSLAAEMTDGEAIEPAAPSAPMSPAERIAHIHGLLGELEQLVD
jgi:hypothetical protein